MGAWKLRVRAGPRVDRSTYEDAGSALAALEARGAELQRDARARTVDLKVLRRFDPVQQVTARLELAGPRRLRAGLDVRGDGSAESWTGVLRRRLIKQRDGESPYAALRRTVESRG
ncbi:MAG: hypothetical protein JOZ25_07625 [Actinobacteria bacterium]|nr:hypothetical protein [Actinomycetota bacterium]